MKTISYCHMFAALLTIGNPLALKSAETSTSGIIEYTFEPNPNPQEAKPRMYNWEIKLNATDSRNGPYEIAQIIKPLNADTGALETKTNILVHSRMIVSNQAGIINFFLYAGDKEPTKNMNGPGNIGQPIAFSGRGTGKAESSWIVLPGAKVDRINPSGKGTKLSGGNLTFVQFLVTNDQGKKFQSDVILRRSNETSAPK